MQNDKANIEAKAKFFSLYLGQQVLVYKQCETPKVLCSYDLCLQNPDINDTDYLLLRSVKQLTDEEWDKLYKIYCNELEYEPTEITKYEFDNGNLYIYFSNKTIDVISFDILPSSCTDYLRSIGVLTKFTTLTSGEVKTYSEEEIIQNGWCILAEN